MISSIFKSIFSLTLLCRKFCIVKNHAFFWVRFFRHQLCLCKKNTFIMSGLMGLNHPPSLLQIFPAAVSCCGHHSNGVIPRLSPPVLGFLVDNPKLHKLIKTRPGDRDISFPPNLPQNLKQTLAHQWADVQVCFINILCPFHCTLLLAD